MKKQRLLPVLLLALFCSGLFAQSGKLPPFRMLLPDGRAFKAEQLPLGKPIVLIYFSPDCDHCSKLMEAVLRKTTPLQKASVAMVTYLPVETVSRFAAQYLLKRFTNFYVGTEGNTYFLKNYYRLSTMPFMALYTRNGDLVKTYPNEAGLPDLLARLQELP